MDASCEAASLVSSLLHSQDRMISEMHGFFCGLCHRPLVRDAEAAGCARFDSGQSTCTLESVTGWSSLLTVAMAAVLSGIKRATARFRAFGSTAKI